MNVSASDVREVLAYMTLQQVGDVYEEVARELLTRGVPLCANILEQREAIDRAERFRLAIATREQTRRES